MLFFSNASILPLLILSALTCQADRRALLNGLFYQHTRKLFLAFPILDFRERDGSIKKGKNGGSSSPASCKFCLLMDVSIADLTGLPECFC